MVALVHVPDVVAREMRAAEHPKWIGYPNPKKFAIQEGKLYFGFGIICLAIAGYPVFRVTAPVAISLLLGAAVPGLMGVYFIFSPLREYWRARHIIYVITNQRLLILNGFQSETRSFVLANIGPVLIELDGDGNGSGTINFSEERVRGSEGEWTVGKVGFKYIPIARETGTLIEDVREQALNSDRRE